MWLIPMDDAFGGRPVAAPKVAQHLIEGFASTAIGAQQPILDPDDVDFAKATQVAGHGGPRNPGNR
jgi:hypothetical protein